MEIMALALGGCLRREPKYGLTEDTGGHITYILGAMRALVEQPGITRGEIVTRLFDAPHLGTVHAEQREEVCPGLTIVRIDSGDRRYLSKEDLAADRAAFTAALISELQARERLPDLIHAHFADAADVASQVREALGIPFVYTPHSLGIDKARATHCQNLALDARIAQEDAAIAAAQAVIASSRDECERQLVSYPSAREEKFWRIQPGIEQRQASVEEERVAAQLIAPFLRHPERPIVLAIARPVRKKNLVALIEGFGRHRDLRDRANLVILPGLRASTEAGEAEQVEVMRELVDAIDRLDLHGTAAWPREHSQAQVRGLYALARRSGGVFVNPALVEPFGLTILEAAVHGLPVVATRIGGPVDMVGQLEHGVLVEPTDPDDIAAGIDMLLSDEVRWQRASRNGAGRVKSLQWSAYASQLAAVARQIVNAPSTGPSKPAARRRLVLCDIDNTLTGCVASAGRFSEFMRGRDDLVFGVATGRSIVEAKRLILEWNLPMPEVWITSVGSEVYWRRGEGLQADLDYAARLARDWDARKVDDVLTGLPELSWQQDIEQRRFKRSFFVEEQQQIDAVASALGQAEAGVRIVHSHRNLLDVLPKSAGKAEAMRHVAARLEIPLRDVIACGDSGNDMDMIEACPNAVVVANCEGGLRELAQSGEAYLAGASYAAGVLEGIEHHLADDNCAPVEAAA